MMTVKMIHFAVLTVFSSRAVVFECFRGPFNGHFSGDSGLASLPRISSHFFQKSTETVQVTPLRRTLASSP